VVDEKLLANIYSGMMPDACYPLKNKKMLMQLQLPGKFMFLLRIRYGLYAVLARMGCECDWYTMEHNLAADALGLK